jgi:hypothetical protein
MRLRRSGKLILGACGLATAGLLYGIARAHMLDKAFERVPAGASQSQVVKLLGKPWKVDRCGELFGAGPVEPDCAEEYLYAPPFAPLTPQYYSVSFDNSGHVVKKYIYSSP